MVSTASEGLVWSTGASGVRAIWLHTRAAAERRASCAGRVGCSPPGSSRSVPGVVEVDKFVFVEAFVAELPVEAFDVTVLRRFAACDNAVGDLPLVRPTFHRQARKFRPVVRDQTGGLLQSSATKSSTRVTRGPGNDGSASIHRHSRVLSSCT